MARSKKEKANSKLLSSAQEALRILIQSEFVSDKSRRQIIDLLSEAVDLCKESTYDGKIRFTVTPRTAKTILETKGTPDFEKKLAEGSRATKQRVYFTLDADPVFMKWVHDGLLKHQMLPGSSLHFQALYRVIRQIEEVLSKSPLQQLADAGF
ncbi:MAG: hypothetical protein MN733_16690 [Nitrososphaera sp.]|nr:hypothetical protein [Nitrososphaera sp.]